MTPAALLALAAIPAAPCVPDSFTVGEAQELAVDERQRIVACLLAENAAAMAATLPRQIDRLTALTGARAEGTHFHYAFRVERSAAGFAAADREALLAGTRMGVCSDTNMRLMIALGATYHYRWTDPQGAPLAEESIGGC